MPNQETVTCPEAGCEHEAQSMDHLVDHMTDAHRAFDRVLRRHVAND